MEFLIVHAGNDPSQFRISSVLYNSVFFNTTEEFIYAYNNNLVQKIVLDPNSDDSWSSLYPRGKKYQRFFISFSDTFDKIIQANAISYSHFLIWSYKKPISS